MKRYFLYKTNAERSLRYRICLWKYMVSSQTYDSEEAFYQDHWTDNVVLFSSIDETELNHLMHILDKAFGRFHTFPPKEQV